jgi:phage-related protein
VRVWLKSLPFDEMRIIGEDIKTVQFGWPLGMPIVRKLEPGLWEVRSKLADKITRVFFTVYGSKMVLLHGFIKKKSEKTPQGDLKVARQRLTQLRGEK